MGYRAIQWATGAMGTASLRALVDHPDIELVGLYVYGEAKAGLDAGTIARRPETGVRATRSIDEILALDADVVVHCARIGEYGSHDAEIIRLLESGKNVITINGYSRPDHWVGPRRDALRAACEKGGSSLMLAGLNPGFIGEQLAVVATGVCARLDSVTVTESVPAGAVRDPEYLFTTLGMGSDPDGLDPNDPSWGPVGALNGMYEEAISAMALHLGLSLERVETDHVVHLAPSDLQLRAGLVKQGTVSHTNWRWHGIVEGRRALTISIHWYVEPSHLPRADPPLWQVEIVGHPGVRITVDLEKHPADTTRMTAEQYALAGTIVNAIPHVVASPPGLVTRPVLTPFRGDYGTAVQP